jgi:hypothetical protein
MLTQIQRFAPIYSLRVPLRGTLKFFSGFRFSANFALEDDAEF